MAGLMNWNVRIIDYLTERGVDPFVKDKFGFTALKKSKIKNFRTITSMLEAYENRYRNHQRTKKGQFISSVTSEEWQKHIKDNNINIEEYRRETLWKRDNKELALFKPSEFFISKSGEYPFSNYEDNQMVFTAVGNFHYYNSNDITQLN